MSVADGGIVGSSIRNRVCAATASGALVGGLTGAVQTIEGISGNPVLAPLKDAAMVLIIPGLIGSTILSGNVHAFSLAFAIVINAVMYFTVGWLLFPLWVRVRRIWQQRA